MSDDKSRKQCYNASCKRHTWNVVRHPCNDHKPIKETPTRFTALKKTQTNQPTCHVAAALLETSGKHQNQTERQLSAITTRHPKHDPHQIVCSHWQTWQHSMLKLVQQNGCSRNKLQCAMSITKGNCHKHQKTQPTCCN